MLHMAVAGYAADNNGALPPSSGDENARLHLFRLFPRTTSWSNESSVLLDAGTLTPYNALYVWLLGYGQNERAPVSQGPRKKYYDFDESRLSNGQYHPSGKPNSPYIYIASTDYLGSGSLALRVPPAGDLENFAASSQPFFNADTFQILCAGTDGVFGNDDDLSNFWPGTRRDYIESRQQ